MRFVLLRFIVARLSNRLQAAHLAASRPGCGKSGNQLTGKRTILSILQNMPKHRCVKVRGSERYHHTQGPCQKAQIKHHAGPFGAEDRIIGVSLKGPIDTPKEPHEFVDLHGRIPCFGEQLGGDVVRNFLPIRFELKDRKIALDQRNRVQRHIVASYRRTSRGFVFHGLVPFWRRYESLREFPSGFSRT